ncbi:MAG: phosphonopyruvate decarboxylase [Chloroflexi bacterium]|nr:phosphonopyruvate decarboxylase [Chloroflexota bacterium]
MSSRRSPTGPCSCSSTSWAGEKDAMRTARLSRPDALRIIAELLPDQPIILTLGGTIREMFSVAGRRPNHLHVLDSMGLSVPIGVGLALGLEEDERYTRVTVIEGDGSLLMGFSVLSTIGLLQPRKLLIIVLDNGVYLATGGQPTAASTTDFVAAARACGFEARDVEGAAGLRQAIEDMMTTRGPVLLRLRVGIEAPPTPYFLEDPVVLAEDFRRWLRR